MARSSYIYIVTHPFPGDHPVIAAFTVKRECEIWLRDCEHHSKHQFVVQRFKDGPWTKLRDVPEPVTFDKSTDA